ncbi:dimethylsulfonioproprionate lyase family protein [Aestuariivirga sp.]|uniref:dimethylsulfonioproprionate lyase family protein n=1 Tax=Aestuariivirga sp. TaxID=2650926 RepID=UPI0039E41022
MSHDETFEDSRWLIGAIARGLHARPAEGVQPVLERLAEQDVSARAFLSPKPTTLPVLRHYSECVAETMLMDPDLAAALAALDGHFWWRQSASYTDAILGEGFSENYGWAEIVGPHGFFKGDDFLLGILMLGPNRHYKDHYHPAPELYWPLTGPTEWKKGNGPFVEKPQGAVIWHPSNVIHATITHEKPLLAVWSWTHDTGTSARLVES